MLVCVSVCVFVQSNGDKQFIFLKQYVRNRPTFLHVYMYPCKQRQIGRWSGI